jgi:hypothetical protein
MIVEMERIAVEIYRLDIHLTISSNSRAQQTYFLGNIGNTILELSTGVYYLGKDAQESLCLRVR